MSTASLRSSYTLWVWQRLRPSPLLLYGHGTSTLILHYMSMATPTLISTFIIWVRLALRSSYTIWVWQRLRSSLFLLYVYGKLYAILRFMSMATPTLISIFIIWVRQALRSSYTIWVCNSYTNFYCFLSQFGKSTLILHYMSMATPRLCSSLLLLCEYGKSTLVFCFMSTAIPTLTSTLRLYGYGKSTLVVSEFLAAVTVYSECCNLADCLGYTVVVSTGHCSLSEQVLPALLISLDIPIRVRNYNQPDGALVYGVTV